MALDFSSLKKNRQTVFDNLTSEMNKLNQPLQTNQSDDTRFWKPTVDKAGNGYAIIRFLPAPEGEDVQFVRVWDHGFQGPGGQWYIEKSLTTIGQKDPVSEHNTELWNSGIEANKDTVRKQKRRLSYYSNIYVVKDPSNPENEGKVFLYKYGKKIFEKLNDACNPEFEGETAINPFDFWEGANFKLKIRKVEGYRNYDKSEFDVPSALSEDDAALEKIWKQQHKLAEFVDPSNFKTYDELKTKLHRVLGLNGSSNMTSNIEEAASPAIKETKAPVLQTAEDDEDLEMFKKLAND